MLWHESSEQIGRVEDDPILQKYPASQVLKAEAFEEIPWLSQAFPVGHSWQKYVLFW